MIDLLSRSNALKAILHKLKSLSRTGLDNPGQQVLMILGIAVLSIVVVIWIEPVDPDLAAKPSRAGGHEIPEFSKFAAGEERKKAFFAYFVPLIKEENTNIQKTRQKLLKWNQNRVAIKTSSRNEIRKIAAAYRLKDFNIEDEANWNLLLRRVDTIPPSLALAQGANESAWGTSRFSRIANNYYGQWCFKRGCGVVPSRRETDKIHEVAAFDSPKESVKKYIHNLNTHDAYKELRKIRRRLHSESKVVTGLELAAGLSRYSERGEEYINELRAMIRFNKLTRFDANEG